MSVTVRPRRCRCAAIVTQLGTQIGAGEWVREADRRRIAARSQEAAAYALELGPNRMAHGLNTGPGPAHPVGGWAGGGFDFLIEVRSVQGLCGSVPRKIRPCAIQHAGEHHPPQVHKRGDVQLDRGHVRRQVTFRGESATAADASVVHQDLHRTACERPRHARTPAGPRDWPYEHRRCRQDRTRHLSSRWCRCPLGIGRCLEPSLASSCPRPRGPRRSL